MPNVPTMEQYAHMLSSANINGKTICSCGSRIYRRVRKSSCGLGANSQSGYISKQLFFKRKELGPLCLMEYSGKAMSQDFMKSAGFHTTFYYERPIARNGKAYVCLFRGHFKLGLFYSVRIGLELVLNWNENMNFIY